MNNRHYISLDDRYRLERVIVVAVDAEAKVKLLRRVNNDTLPLSENQLAQLADELEYMAHAIRIDSLYSTAQVRDLEHMFNTMGEGQENG